MLNASYILALSLLIFLRSFFFIRLWPKCLNLSDTLLWIKVNLPKLRSLALHKPRPGLFGTNQKLKPISHISAAWRHNNTIIIFTISQSCNREKIQMCRNIAIPMDICYSNNWRRRVREQKRKACTQMYVTDEGAYNNLATSNERQSKMRRIFFIWLGAGAKEEGAYPDVRNWRRSIQQSCHKQRKAK